jgi:hypothetical protein
VSLYHGPFGRGRLRLDRRPLGAPFQRLCNPCRRDLNVRSCERMLGSVTTRSKVTGLLLCALLAVMSIVSPMCPACSGFGSQHIGHTPVAGKGLPPANDDCNGVCSCCGFQWLPAAQMRPPAVAVVTPPSIPQSGDYPSRSTPPPFQPPRA